MREPPESIDGAKVLFWAISHPQPFFTMASADGGVAAKIHGLAVCQYPNGTTYRFSCNEEWETENDADYDTPEDAMFGLSGQYDVAAVKWIGR